MEDFIDNSRDDATWLDTNMTSVTKKEDGFPVSARTNREEYQ